MSDIVLKLPFGSVGATASKATFRPAQAQQNYLVFPAQIADSDRRSLAEKADDARWDALFAESSEYFAEMAAKIRAEHDAGRLEVLDLTRL